jgi:hypothetical protein
MHENPAGHATHVIPREPQAFGAEPLTHWPFAQHPFAHDVGLQAGVVGPHDDDNRAETPIRADRPNHRRVVEFTLVLLPC